MKPRKKSQTEEDRVFAEAEYDLPEDLHDVMIDGSKLTDFGLESRSYLDDDGR